MKSLEQEIQDQGGFNDSQDVFGLLSAPFKETQIQNANNFTAQNVQEESLVSERVMCDSMKPESTQSGLLGLLSGQFSVPQAAEPTNLTIENSLESNVKENAPLTSHAVADFFAPKSASSKPDTELKDKMDQEIEENQEEEEEGSDIEGDDSDYGHADDSESEESEPSESVGPVFLQQSKSIADLIGDDTDSEAEKNENGAEVDADDEDSDSDSSSEQDDGEPKPLRAILTWKEPVVKADGTNSGSNNPQQKPRNKFIDAEAEVEEDEFMNYGGNDGEDINDQNEYDKSMVNDANDEDVNLEAIAELAK